MNIITKLHCVADILHTHGYTPRYVSVSDDHVLIDEQTFRKMFAGQRISITRESSSRAMGEAEWQGFKWRANLWMAMPEIKPVTETVVL